MKKVIVDQEFWELFPEAEIQLLVCKEIDNHVVEAKQKDYRQMLADAKEISRQYIPLENFSDNEVVQEWRQAFTKFKTKKGARSTIENLLKRVSQDRDFDPIIPLVDIYNSVSMRYGVSCGGEDIDNIVGDMHLGMAKGGESFFPLGAEEDAPALPGEICYFDNEGAICRCFNWREAQRTMLREETRNAVLVIESINKVQADRAKDAVQLLKELVDEHFGIHSEIRTLTINQPQAELM